MRDPADAEEAKQNPQNKQIITAEIEFFIGTRRVGLIVLLSIVLTGYVIRYFP
jgi:hypothetical protein